MRLLNLRPNDDFVAGTPLTPTSLDGPVAAHFPESTPLLTAITVGCRGSQSMPPGQNGNPRLSQPRDAVCHS
jgi:hypothetical protein